MFVCTALILLLGTASEVRAQFQVYPMRVGWTAVAGESIEGQVTLINPSSHQAQVLIKIVDMAQNAENQWLPVDESTEASDPPLHYTKASCRSWITLIEPAIPVTTVPPARNANTPTQKIVRFCVDVPSTCTGSHVAALKIRFQTTSQNRASTMHLDFVVPVMLEVVPADPQIPATALGDLVTDISIMPSALSRQAPPGHVVPLILHLKNRHPHQAHSVTVCAGSDMTDASGRTSPTWIRDLPTTPVTLDPNDANSLKVEIDIPTGVQGRFDSSLTLMVTPGDLSHLGPVLACLIPIHLNITPLEDSRHRSTPIASPLRIITPRPFEISGNRILGALAVYSSTPVYLRGTHRDSPWNLTAQPHLIQSDPLAGLYGEVPSWDPNDMAGLPPVILTVSPALP